MSVVDQALQAQARAEAGGPMYDGPAYAAYLRERVRAEVLGQKASVKPPKATTLAALKNKARK